eukprot:3372409-Pyramimonas_sp.AAC.2
MLNIFEHFGGARALECAATRGVARPAAARGPDALHQGHGAEPAAQGGALPQPGVRHPQHHRGVRAPPRAHGAGA